ncbi:hypothetical protein JCGZ_24091 [Jatropha curcas]|uniref:Uncharacterized protein n=1 Tax=Jatropha curcas TaxID=180498 RepID=A0A067LER8_JATCU|nr:hypothetical protein JCGZ_24091 [Jatropha curcas]
MAAPVPVGMIDSLGVLGDKFGRRAGNLKMATLATYFGLGQQKHRTRSRSNGKLQCGEESSRKSPPSTIGYQRTVPYTRGSLGKVTEGVKNLFCKAQETKSINKLIKHSHSLLR